VQALFRAEAGQEFNQEAARLLHAFFQRYQFMSQFSYALAIPPANPEEDRDGWTGVGLSLMETARRAKLDPAVKLYATMVKAYDENQPEVFNQALTEYQQHLEKKGLDREIKKGKREFVFSNFAPFYKSMTVYVLAFMLAAGSWLNWSQWMNRSAFYLILFGLVLHTAGLITRMMLEGRPPVTNLYSSAVFVGWGAVVLGAILERIFRDGIGSVTASSVGFLSLLIAHYLSLDGDTMQMLQAVLDTNFWLATHVVVITLGYSATFLAGFLAILYIFRGFFTSSLSQAMSKTLGRMVYGIICFALLFSFVGTILGGIWADQSWGRFWGWDPKENGALIIVIWNAVILHARWGGLIRERGLMNMAIFGNIVTSFSWFGTNMLGVGLHSYGFMDEAFFWLMAFVVSQVTIIGLGLVPLRYWASFRDNGRGPGTPPAQPEERQNIPQSAGT
jgi:ABC-type transport system involved in cytochrome c biogenesis permease subunit